MIQLTFYPPPPGAQKTYCAHLDTNSPGGVAVTALWTSKQGAVAINLPCPESGVAWRWNSQQNSAADTALAILADHLHELQLACQCGDPLFYLRRGLSITGYGFWATYYHRPFLAWLESQKDADRRVKVTTPQIAAWLEAHPRPEQFSVPDPFARKI